VNRVRDRFPSRVLASIRSGRQAVLIALEDWSRCLPQETERRCPILELWFHREFPIKKEAKFEWAYPGRSNEIAAAFLTRAEFNLPGRRRPTLDEYERKRTQFVDRYTYGIYGRS